MTEDVTNVIEKCPICGERIPEGLVIDYKLVACQVCLNGMFLLLAKMYKESR